MITRPGPVARGVIAAALSAILSLALLGGCGDDDKESDDGPGSAPQDEGG